MKKKDNTESRHKLTKDTNNDHTNEKMAQGTPLAHIDPRIVELVRFLARVAAEKDYAEFIDKTRRETETGSEKETLQ